MKSVITLEKSFREYDISFLRKVVSRINILKISNPALNKYIVELDNGVIVARKEAALIESPKIDTVEIEKTDMPISQIALVDFYQQPVDEDPTPIVNKVIREAINFIIKNSNL